MSKRPALVVEDDDDLAFIFGEALRSGGFEVEVIKDGGKAIARLAEIAPVLVVLDLHLPHLSGMNVLRQIRAEKRLLDTRVIVATADAALAEELRDMADVVLLKPILFSQVRDLALRLVPSIQASSSSNGRGSSRAYQK